jgi:hypothetical protein
MNLRPREVEKEIAGLYKTKAKTSIDRVFDSIMTNHPHTLNWQEKQKLHLNPPCGDFA